MEKINTINVEFLHRICNLIERNIDEILSTELCNKINEIGLSFTEQSCQVIFIENNKRLTVVDYMLKNDLYYAYWIII